MIRNRGSLLGKNHHDLPYFVDNFCPPNWVSCLARGWFARLARWTLKFSQEEFNSQIKNQHKAASEDSDGYEEISCNTLHLGKCPYLGRV